jgi:serine-type D-Ala-D-Ala carboxypeptidase/endopeptidase (penicillin-binding protein 4)
MRSVPRFVVAVLVSLGVLGAQSEPVAAQAPVPSAAARASALERAVEELGNWAQKNGAKAGVAVLDASSGRTVVALHDSLALNPASNTKLLTAAAALERLGPDYRYLTGLYGALRNGATGDLVLRGHGDPSLRVRDLSELVRELVARGLRRVEGRILVDQSRFDDDHLPPGYDQRPGEWASYRAPVSAVALERNTVALNVLASDQGQPATLWFEPPGFVEVSGTIETHGTGSGQAIELKLRAQGQRLKAEVGGHVARGLGLIRTERRVDDPRLFAGFVLAQLLRGQGVECKGEVALSGSGERRILVSHRSEPLGVLIRELGKSSDNFYAEMILKTLGAEAEQGTGSSPRGVQAVLAWLKSAGLEDPGTSIKNGSGLYDANRVSAFTLARLLIVAANRPSIEAEFLAQLAVGGVDGTLKSRFRHQRATRTVRAKTGTLADVDALSGYVLASRGRPRLVFSILVNGPLGDHREARRRIDRIVEEAVALADR